MQSGYQSHNHNASAACRANITIYIYTLETRFSHINAILNQLLLKMPTRKKSW